MKDSYETPTAHTPEHKYEALNTGKPQPPNLSNLSPRKPGVAAAQTANTTEETYDALDDPEPPNISKLPRQRGREMPISSKPTPNAPKQTYDALESPETPKLSLPQSNPGCFPPPSEHERLIQARNQNVQWSNNNNVNGQIRDYRREDWGQTSCTRTTQTVTMILQIFVIMTSFVTLVLVIVIWFKLAALDEEKKASDEPSGNKNKGLGLDGLLRGVWK